MSDEQLKQLAPWNSALSHTYAMQMYNSSKKATENTVDELTGEQLTFENVVVCFADMDAYAGDSHDVQEVQYIKGGDAYLFTRGGVQVGRWEKTYPTNPLKLYTKSGEEMTLNRGKTYFALVDNDELSNFSYHSPYYSSPTNNRHEKNHSHTRTCRLDGADGNRQCSCPVRRA